jgi:hypothetical protein
VVINVLGRPDGCFGNHIFIMGFGGDGTDAWGADVACTTALFGRRAVRNAPWNYERKRGGGGLILRTYTGGVSAISLIAFGTGSHDSAIDISERRISRSSLLRGTERVKTCLVSSGPMFPWPRRQDRCQYGPVLYGRANTYHHGRERQ